MALVLVRVDSDLLVGKHRLSPLLILDPAAFRAWLLPIG